MEYFGQREHLAIEEVARVYIQLVAHISSLRDDITSTDRDIIPLLSNWVRSQEFRDALWKSRKR